MQKDSLLKGTAVLGSALIIAKFFGLIYRLILPNLVGSQVMGLYGMSYSVYAVLLTLSMAGIPIAVSKLISGYTAVNDYKGAKRVFRIAFISINATGLFFSLILFFGANYIAENITGDPRAALSLQAVAPAIFVVSLMSSFRGYFQGLQQMTKTAVSQLLEQFLRVFGIIFFAYLLLPKGEEFAAAGASFGNVIGAFIGFCYLLFCYIKTPFQGKGEISSVSIADEKAIEIVKKIFYLSFPIIIGNLIMPMMNLIDATVVVNRLTETGFSQHEATALFAYLSQYATPLIRFPGTLGMALAMSLVPAISESISKNEMEQAKRRGRLAFRFAILVGLPSSVGMFIMAEPIINLIFPGAPGASRVLMFLSPAVVFLITKYATTGILQGLGKTMIPVKNLFIGAILKLIITYLLTSIPEINVIGAALGTVIAQALAMILNYKKVKELLDVELKPGVDFIKPLLCSLIMGLVVFVTYNGMSFFISNNLAAISGIGIGVLSYSILLLILQVIGKEELYMVPRYGPPFVRLMEKVMEKIKVW